MLNVNVSCIIVDCNRMASYDAMQNYRFTKSAPFKDLKYSQWKKCPLLIAHHIYAIFKSYINIIELHTNVEC